MGRKMGLALPVAVIMALHGLAAVPPSTARKESGAASGRIDLDRYLGSRWYGLYFMDGKVGYAETEVAKSAFGGKDAVTVAFRLAADVAMMGAPQRMTITETRTYVLGKGLVSFRSVSESAGGRVIILGEPAGGKMRISSEVGGERKTRLTEMPRERFEDYIAEERLVGKDAKVGSEITSVQYQPSLGKSITAVSRVKEIRTRKLHGIPTRVYVIETTLKELGVTSATLVDAEGEVLQSEVAGVFTMRLEDEALAKRIDYRSDVLLSSVIRPKTRIKNPSRVKEMTVVLTGIKNPALLPRSDRQSYENKPDGRILLKVRVEDLSEMPIARIPLSEERFREDLAPGLFIQSANPKVVAVARSVVGEERNALKASGKIVKWVYRNLKKRFSASFSNALDVLATREGDCTEHSVLYVALARAAGIPAREVSGLIYSADDGGFYYHQWARAYVGRWIDVDPTFDEEQADATHIELASGGLFSQAKLIPLVGSLGVEIKEYGYGGVR